MIVLSKTAKRVLAFIKNSTPNVDKEFYFFGDMDLSPLSISKSDFCTAVERLIEVNALKRFSDKCEIFEITDLGKNFSYYQKQYILSFLFKSVLVPIFVSLITTIITLFISNIM